MDRVSGADLGRKAGGAMIIAIAAIALTACSDIAELRHLQPLPINPASPVAGDVAKAEAVPRAPAPPFTAIPPKPTDVPTAAAYKAEVVNVVGDRRTLNQWIAANPAGVNDTAETESYAEKQRQIFAHESQVSPSQQAESEAFAKRLREAAEAPPLARPDTRDQKKPDAKKKPAQTAPNL